MSGALAATAGGQGSAGAVESAARRSRVEQGEGESGFRAGHGCWQSSDSAVTSVKGPQSPPGCQGRHQQPHLSRGGVFKDVWPFYLITKNLKNGLRPDWCGSVGWALS